MIIFPKSPNQYTLPAWNQSNNSDSMGSIYSSFNIDVTENEGKVRLGKRLILNTASTDITMFCPVAFKLHNSTLYSLGGSTSADGTPYKISQTEISSASYAVDNSSNAPTDIDSRLSDMENGSNGRLYATGNAKLYECDSSGAWSATTRSLTGGKSHMLCVFNERVYVIDLQSQVRSCDISAGAVMGTLTTSGNNYLKFYNSDANTLTFLRSSASRMWIGSLNTLGGKGYIYEWDGITTNYQKAYRLEASGALACIIKDDIPWVVDSDGNLLAWNGASFIKIDSFYRKNNKPLYRSTSAVNDRFIHPNGMSIVNGNIRILINNLNGDNGGTIEETIASGVWEYTKEKGLVHIGSLGLSKVGDTIIDYGQNRISQVGAISNVNSPTTSPSSNKNGLFLVGASVFSDASTVKHGIFYDDTNDTLQKAGYLILPKVYAQDERGFTSIKNSWNNFHTLYRKFLDSNDKIEVKYRTSEVVPVEVTITWTSTTTFTTTTDVSAYVNYEVEVIQGLGSGKCSQITSVTGSGTFTVTVDQVYTGATGTSKARFQFWKRISSITGQLDTHDQSSAGEITNWIQFKVWMLFTGKDEIEKLIVVNENKQPVN